MPFSISETARKSATRPSMRRFKNRSGTSIRPLTAKIFTAIREKYSALGRARIDRTRSGCRPEALCESRYLCPGLRLPRNAYRTSNMNDRHMIPLDRWLSASRYFHGHWASAELQIRTWVLFHDFMPFCPRAKIAERAISPVHKTGSASSITMTGFTTCSFQLPAQV